MLNLLKLHFCYAEYWELGICSWDIFTSIFCQLFIFLYIYYDIIQVKLAVFIINCQLQWAIQNSKSLYCCVSLSIDVYDVRWTLLYEMNLICFMFMGDAWYIHSTEILFTYSEMGRWYLSYKISTECLRPLDNKKIAFKVGGNF